VLVAWLVGWLIGWFQEIVGLMTKHLWMCVVITFAIGHAVKLSPLWDNTYDYVIIHPPRTMYMCFYTTQYCYYKLEVVITSI
jgi:hypothetical protein